MSGSTRSTGWCITITMSRKTGTPVRHGEATYGSPTVEYRTWKGMKDRCYNSASRSYHNYGGRGIRVCDEWLNDPKAFIDHIGRKPGPEYSVDRIDNDKGYQPGNVRWATREVQLSNRRPFKLDDESVRQIRCLTALKLGYADIAKLFSISKSMVCLIYKGRAWT